MTIHSARPTPSRSVLFAAHVAGANKTCGSWHAGCGLVKGIRLATLAVTTDSTGVGRIHLRHFGAPDRRRSAVKRAGAPPSAKGASERQET